MNKVMDVLIDMIREERHIAHEYYELAILSRKRKEYSLYNTQLNEYHKHIYAAETIRSILDRLQD